MSKITETRENWVKGPWDDEPNDKYWVHRGLDCMILRSPILGNLCGYVGIPSTHKFYGKSYNDLYDENIECHGGLTFSDTADSLNNHYEVKKDVWWFGFDCAHAFDLVPSIASVLPDGFSFREEYRDIKYVTEQVESLARQLSNKDKEKHETF